jgi:hypothetical protein
LPPFLLGDERGGALADMTMRLCMMRERPHQVLQVEVRSPAEAFAFDSACAIAAEKYRHEKAEEAMFGVTGIDAVLHDIRLSLRRLWTRG